MTIAGRITAMPRVGASGPPGFPVPSPAESARSASQADTLFSTVYDTLGPPATQRVRSILARRDADTAALAAHHTSTIAGSTAGYR
ncbi:hypothetical protein [Streptomyces sp. NPDC002845]